MRTVLLPLLIVGAGCQTYDFEPVSPLSIAQTTQSRNVVSRNLKPNLMLLVDKSGSMRTAVPSGGTRISELRNAMGQFLMNSSRVARMGLAFFPSETTPAGIPMGCGPSASISVPIPPPTATDADDAPLVATANQINMRIQSLDQPSGIPVTGGTPTGSSLGFLATQPSLTDDTDNRQDFVLLLTDGLPNCNPSNPLSCSSMPRPPDNLCTLGSVMGTLNCAGQYCQAGYLDKDGVVTTVKQLKSRNINVIVIGFGADFAEPQALDVLNSMAAEGGFGRKCPNGTNAECGTNNTCLPSRFCEKQFYSAQNANELARALADIQNLINSNDPCNFDLVDKPTDDRFLAVIINGQNTQKGAQTWTLLPNGSVQFAGPLCDRVKSSTTADPLKVEFRIVNSL